MKLFDIDFSKPVPAYYLVAVIVAACVYVIHRLSHSYYGNALRALREDDQCADAMGINTPRLKLESFTVSGFFAGVAGALWAHTAGYISPADFNFNVSILILSMVVLGGLGHIPGVILGAILLAALPEVLRYVAGPLQQLTGGRLDAAILRQLLIALAMISIMLLRPRGLWPAPEHGKAAPSPASAG